MGRYDRYAELEESAFIFSWFNGQSNIEMNALFTFFWVTTVAFGFGALVAKLTNEDTEWFNAGGIAAGCAITLIIICACISVTSRLVGGQKFKYALKKGFEDGIAEVGKLSPLTYLNIAITNLVIESNKEAEEDKLQRE